MGLTTQQSIRNIQKALDYQFKDINLLRSALEHNSARDEINERLEFLGDAALELAVSHILFKQFSHIDVGELTVMRSNLVNNSNLATIAEDYGINRKSILGSTDEFNDGESNKLCADIFEAVIGAIYLDGGYEALEKFIQEKVVSNCLDEMVATKHPKTKLQEWCAAKSIALPEYSVDGFEYVANSSLEEWKVTCRVNFDAKQLITKGQGPSKRHAERNAATFMLEKLPT